MHMSNSIESKIFITEPQADYELLDSGLNYKLERYGRFVLSRPDPQALWPTNRQSVKWQSADAEFKKEDESGDAGERGSWHVNKKKDKGDIQGIKKSQPEDLEDPSKAMEKWSINFGGLRLQIKLSPFKHTGLFPEQLSNWQFMEKIIQDEVVSGARTEPIKVLNLFGYTGGASLICAKAGAEVTHVDASKSAITWANENAELSGLSDKPIRWILDDALAFVKKEIRRGVKYDAIVMDPPSYGRGAKGELWKIEEGFLDLVEGAYELLSDKPLFFVLNGYSAGYSAMAYAQNLEVLKTKHGGSIEFGELAIQESKGAANEAGRLLPCGIVARWKI